jgi:hypothetical protein
MGVIGAFHDPHTFATCRALPSGARSPSTLRSPSTVPTHIEVHTRQIHLVPLGISTRVPPLGVVHFLLFSFPPSASWPLLPVPPTAPTLLLSRLRGCRLVGACLSRVEGVLRARGRRLWCSRRPCSAAKDRGDLADFGCTRRAGVAVGGRVTERLNNAPGSNQYLRHAGRARQTTRGRLREGRQGPPSFSSGPESKRRCKARDRDRDRRAERQRLATG